MQRTTAPTGGPGASSQDTILRGVGIGLAPAAFFYVGILVGFGVVSLLRVATSGLGFLTQLPVLNVASFLCLVALAVGFTVVSVRAFRWARRWREDGETTAANAVIWGLAVSALLVLVPVLLAILLPQHPAYIV
jgi:hypothetical protein